MNELTVQQAALIAQKVYDLQDYSIEEQVKRDTLGCENEFHVGKKKYEDDKDRERELGLYKHFKGVTGVYQFKLISSFGYICDGRVRPENGDGVSRRNQVLLVVRGTHPTWLRDWLTNAHTSISTGPGGMPVHYGFMETFKSFQSEINRFLETRNPTVVHCVGHSLGGALATLCADYLESRGIPAKLYTFGSPRVGFRGFADQLTQRMTPPAMHRVAHTTDPVPMVPAWTGSFPFTHAPSYGGRSLSIHKSGLLDFGAHGMEAYVSSVRSASWGTLTNTKADELWDDAMARTFMDSVLAGTTFFPALHSFSLARLTNLLKWLVIKALPYLTEIGAWTFTSLDMLGLLLSKVYEIASELTEDILKAMQVVAKFLGRTWEGAKELAKKAAEKAKEMAAATMDAVKKGVGMATQAGKDAAKATGDAMKKAGEATGDALKKAGLTMAEGAEIVARAIRWLFDEFSAVVNRMVSQALNMIMPQTATVGGSTGFRGGRSGGGGASGSWSSSTSSGAPTSSPLSKDTDLAEDSAKPAPTDKKPTVTYKDGWNEDKILDIPHGERPAPSEYLEDAYIESHLAKFDNGAAFLTPKVNLDSYGRDPFGRSDGLFIMTKDEVDEVLSKTGGQVDLIEKELGIPPGTWQGKEMVRVDIEDPRALSLRIPSGNEAGANEYWLPGGFLPTGNAEAVVDPIPASSYKESIIS